MDAARRRVMHRVQRRRVIHRLGRGHVTARRREIVVIPSIAADAVMMQVGQVLLISAADAVGQPSQ